MDTSFEPEQPEGVTPALGNADPLPPGRGRRRFRLRRLALKELRETLRDRRTIITLILMPLLVYPVLSLVFRTFLVTNAGLFQTDNKPIVFKMIYTSDRGRNFASEFLNRVAKVVDRYEKEQRLKQSTDDVTMDDGDRNLAAGDGATPAVGALDPPRRMNRFAPFKDHRWGFIEATEETIGEILESEQADIGVAFERDEDDFTNVGRVRIFTRGDPRSKAAASYLERSIEVFNDQMREVLLQQAGLPTEPALKLIEQSVGEEKAAESEDAFSLASLIPLILVLMTITGAVYPAIDLTAGEKERGTLETLMAAPIPRIGILLSKFSAVLTVAVLTAVLNIVGMAATVWAFRLDQFLPGSSEFTLVVVIKILLLLILFAAFFSALLLVVTSYARSFKEAQAYLIPIILVSMGPGLIAMSPGLKLAGPWAVTPMINILLLARDVIQNQVELVPAGIAILSTILYASAAIVLAARIFGSDAILYSSHGSFGELFSRPKRVQRRVPVSAAVFCVALLFPINFILIGFLGRLPSETTGDLSMRFAIMGGFTFLSFVAFPYLIARHQNANLKTAFGIQGTRVVFFLSAILLGISLWPLVMSAISGWHEVYGWFAGAEQRDAWHERLVEETAEQVARVRMVSPFLIAISLSLLPAICEEWFFRGMLLRSLMRTRKVWTAIIVSSVVFGLFHVLSNSVIALDRLVPTTLVGIALGYIAYKSDSIWPGILLHAIHNGAVSFLAYYQPQLSRFSWFPGEEDPIPTTWVVAGAVIALTGFGLLLMSKPVSRPPEPVESSGTGMGKPRAEASN